MESWNRLTAVTGEEGGGNSLKEGEGISQRTCMKNSMDMYKSEGIDHGSGGRVGQRWAKGKNWDNCNSINNNKIKI